MAKAIGENNKEQIIKKYGLDNEMFDLALTKLNMILA